ncbi:MAG: hypothetical protein NTX50_03685 [Candidatus Sumerlaeota bacterium]|nr:hypothetical protein [Candidatus Sumerlaeota bacterium]
MRRTNRTRVILALIASFCLLASFSQAREINFKWFNVNQQLLDGQGKDLLTLETEFDAQTTPVLKNADFTVINQSDTEVMTGSIKEALGNRSISLLALNGLNFISEIFDVQNVPKFVNFKAANNEAKKAGELSAVSPIDYYYSWWGEYIRAINCMGFRGNSNTVIFRTFVPTYASNWFPWTSGTVTFQQYLHSKMKPVGAALTVGPVNDMQSHVQLFEQGVVVFKDYTTSGGLISTNMEFKPFAKGKGWTHAIVNAQNFNYSIDGYLIIWNVVTSGSVIVSVDIEARDPKDQVIVKGPLPEFANLSGTDGWVELAAATKDTGIFSYSKHDIPGVSTSTTTYVFVAYRNAKKRITKLAQFERKFETVPNSTWMAAGAYIVKFQGSRVLMRQYQWVDVTQSGGTDFQIPVDNLQWYTIGKEFKPNKNTIENPDPFSMDFYGLRGPYIWFGQDWGSDGEYILKLY